MANDRKPLFDKPIGGGPDEEGTMNLQPALDAYAKKLGFNNILELISKDLDEEYINRKKSKKADSNDYQDERGDIDS